MHGWIKVKVKIKLVFFLLPKCQLVLVLIISKAGLGVVLVYTPYSRAGKILFKGLDLTSVMFA